MSTATVNGTEPVPRTVIVPVQRGTRAIGAYVTQHQETTFVPAVDVTVIAVAAMATVAVATASVCAGIALRRRPAIGSVTMGPGGWVSLKRAAQPPLRAARTARPWWAHALRAHRLVTER